MQGVKTKGGLPQPYYLRPKQQGFLTTPMKKLLAYLFVLFVFGFIIYEATPKPQKVDTEYELDKQQHEVEVQGQRLDKAGGAVGGVDVDVGGNGGAGAGAGSGSGSGGDKVDVKGGDVADIQAKKNIIAEKEIKEKLGGIDLDKAHEDTNHIIDN